ncbi:MAG TPA: cation transporter [Longimicrobiales bacterium]
MATTFQGAAGEERTTLVRRSALLNLLTLGYNVVEALVSLAAGLVAGSVALVGFGIDSGIEVTAGAAALWRLRSDADPERRERSERRTLRLIGGLFLLLAAYVTVDSGLALWTREAPERSIVGVIILALSVVIMPVLSRAKKKAARSLGSGALAAEATQTSLCAWLSAIALAGVGLNVLFGWWWADPVAALVMVPIIAREGIEGVQARDCCDDCAH